MAKRRLGISKTRVKEIFNECETEKLNDLTTKLEEIRNILDFRPLTFKQAVELSEKVAKETQCWKIKAKS